MYLGLKMKIAIVGVGGVGGYIGAILSKNNHDITLIARGNHFDTIEQQGLKVNDNGEEFITKPQLIHSNNKEELSKQTFDVVFLTTKSYDFQSACESIKNSITSSTIIIPLSNGVEHKTELANYLDKGILSEGCIYIVSHIKEAGFIVKKAPKFYLVFGSDKQDEKFEQLAKILNEANLKSKYSNNIKYDCWRKYLFISSFASLTSYFKEPMGYIVNEQREFLEEVVNEVKNVANALKIPISDEDVEKTITQATNIPYNSKTSMQLDFQANHKTELESLCGYVVKKGKELDIATPKMQMIYTKLKTN
jgi:2-dehydropantoate 2-reductase